MSAASAQVIAGWLKWAPEEATHMLVYCDTYDYSDYPVYVKADASIIEGTKIEIDGLVTIAHSTRDVIQQKTGNMQRLMECYSLSMDHESQLSEHRAFHYD